ncbi:MAG TPA: alpha/beta hydrolase [Candidatus Dormibacteraeota bacterium]|nr:alpha/beta hydrolase [Candidatus Dormibacteraeota bacterium]
MPRLKANGIEIEYDTFGDAKAAPLLLIMGLGAQMISWDEAFCAQLADRGFYVIRYDNRDSGLSTKMEAAGVPDLLAAFSGNPTPAYELEDLAADAVGVLDALDIDAAHIVGASMGGFISQLIAINYPERVLSLTSIMSGPGGHDAVAPTPEGAEVLMKVPLPTREGTIEHGVWIRKVLTGSGNPFDEDAERKKVERAYDRSYYPVGTGRQMVAILAAHGRLERLAKVIVPTLVVHGLDDVLVPPENGRLVAGAVPGARLLEFETMGHNVPERFWPQILDAIAANARQVASPQPR